MQTFQIEQAFLIFFMVFCIFPVFVKKHVVVVISAIYLVFLAL